VHQEAEKRRQNSQFREKGIAGENKKEWMILVYPNTSLRKKAGKIAKLSPETEKAILQLEKDLSVSEIGVGLSAPQIGKNLPVFVIQDHSYRSSQDHHCGFRIFINPGIVSSFGAKKTYPQVLDADNNREDFYEGCLSFPDLYGTVKRWLKIKTAYQMPGKSGKLIDREEVLTDLLAIVFQHELDHLEGIVFPDRVKKEGGKLFYRGKSGEIEEISWERFEKLF